MNWRGWAVVTAVALVGIGVFLLPAIPQPEAYHRFADTRAFLGIPNALNVVSNFFFLPVGLLGMRFVSHKWDKGGTPFLDRRERLPYFVFFLGVTLTAFGSAYYHWHPDDRTLVWDRLPMAIGFGSLLAATIAERVNLRLGLRLLFPLLLIDAGTVIYWSTTQSSGHGDLRPYALAQFGSLLVIVLLVALYPARYTRGADLLIALGIYGIAKIFEAADRMIFSWGGIVSGHTLKHLVAALSVWWILHMLRHRAPRFDNMPRLANSAESQA
ncbi:MAG TPA: alkaline phytoceramidase [Verrucomicrobiae bacterium]|nr:alkaline phytoceramidase [Verrucomicrobiae bacterium]